jgi:hypothetical protein
MKKTTKKYIIFIFVLALDCQAQELVFHANELVAQKNYKKAIDIYEKILAKNPNNINVLNSLSYAYAWDKQYSKALLSFKELIAKEPNNYENYIAKAKIFFWQGDNKNAVLELKKIPKLSLSDSATKEINKLSLKFSQKQSSTNYFNLSINSAFEYFSFNKAGGSIGLNFKYKYKQRYFFLFSYLMRKRYENTESNFGAKFGVIFPSFTRVSIFGHYTLNPESFPVSELGLEIDQKLNNYFDIGAGYRFLNYENIFSHVIYPSLRVNIANLFSIEGRVYFSRSTFAEKGSRNTLSAMSKIILPIGQNYRVDIGYAYGHEIIEASTKNLGDFISNIIFASFTFPISLNLSASLNQEIKLRQDKHFALRSRFLLSYNW